MLRVLLAVVGMGLIVGFSPLVAFSDAGSGSLSLISRAAGSLNSIHGSGTGLMLVARRSSAEPERTGPTKARQTRNRAEYADSDRKDAAVSPAGSSSGTAEVRTSANVPSDKSGGARAVEEKISSAETLFKYMEIEVSHSAHTFQLRGVLPSGQRQQLHECKVGLGGPGFPTPVGIYYVTHIYDEDPWWIPPKDRAWAAGDSPSKRVYGGTMAPLLKKRPVRLKKQAPEPEDMIASEVQLDDYGYRFHGTNQPRSIGRNQSHGCVRMIPADAKKVATLIKQFVGEAERKESENGSFAVLRAPVRLNLVK